MKMGSVKNTPPFKNTPPKGDGFFLRGGILKWSFWYYWPAAGEFFWGYIPLFEGKCIILEVQIALKMKENDARG